MTREEFDLWIDYHSQEVFPGVDTWLRAMTPSKLFRCLKGWWVRLQHVQIEHAQQASQDLLEGGTDPPFGQHALKVASLARKYRPKMPEEPRDVGVVPTPEQRLAACIKQQATDDAKRKTKHAEVT